MKILKTLLGMALICPTVMLAQNPLVNTQFTADPTARVFGDRVYVYPSHDIPAPEDYARKDWFCMADYHVYSSDNLTDWTDLGMILSQENVPWGNPKAYSMWAPDCVQGPDGRYYFYFPNAPKDGRGFGVGVAIADSPTGPFVPQEKNIDGISGIDPCVLQASDGNAYIYWGGGGLRVAKLKPNLLELAEDNPTETRKFGDREMTVVGKAADADLPAGFKEGPFAFERNGWYYLTYPWVREEGGSETLAYAMSKNPMGPWEFKGLIMAEHPNRCWTNHHSIINYKGQWYLFYHHNDYSPNFDKNRSMCADSLFFNADGTIQQVVPTNRGVGVTDGLKLVQMDRGTLSNGAVLEFNKKNEIQQAIAKGSIDSVAMRMEGWKVRLPKGGKAVYPNVSLPEGEFQALVSTTSSWGRRQQIKQLAETTLDIVTTKQKNGLLTVTMSNHGKDTVDVDWITFVPRKPLFSDYFEPSKGKNMAPDANGFIRRWNIQDPIDKPNNSNTVFVDSYLREAFYADYSEQTKDFKWHQLDSKLWNVKLFRFASCRDKQVYGVLFFAETIIDCAAALQDVRLSAGSNSASMWWIDGKEVLILSGDRRMVQDDGQSSRLNLSKGKHTIRCAVINGPGMSDFCVRFLDSENRPVTNFKILNK